MKRIYISGPITGYRHLNRPTFSQAESELAAVGLTPVNPFNLIEPADYLTWVDYMKADIAALIECDGVATLPGWQESRGARVEVELAHALQIPVMPIFQWIDHHHA